FGIYAKSRELHGAVAGGNPQQQAAATQLVDTGGCLSQVQRMPDRHHNGTGSQSNISGLGCDVAQVGPGVVDLTYVSKAGVAQWHVTKPQCGKTSLFCLLSKLHLILHAGRVTLESLDGKEQPQRHFPRLKGSCKTRQGLIFTIRNCEHFRPSARSCRRAPWIPYSGAL